jgi:hypothetical protein
MRRSIFLIGIAAFIAVAWPAVAQTPSPPVEPEAVAILKAAGERLAAARTLTFTATAMHDTANAEGQSLFFVDRSQVELRRPDNLRVVTRGDGPTIEFLSDGRTMTLFRPRDGTVATAPAPRGIEEILKAEVETFGQTQAFADMLLADPSKAFTEGLTRAYVVGRSRLVGGTQTDIVAFASGDAHGQIWIGVTDRLPRQLWVTETGAPNRPRNGVTFSDWSIDRPLSARIFSAAHTTHAKSVPFAKPNS